MDAGSKSHQFLCRSLMEIKIINEWGHSWMLWISEKLWKSIAIFQPYCIIPSLLRLNHMEKKTKKSKAQACLFVVLSSTVSTWINVSENCYRNIKLSHGRVCRRGDNKGVQILNLMGEFELQKMKYGASFICPTISIVYALFS